MKQTTRLLEIMARLRDPVHGCAWDLKQDFYSLAPYTLEEAYEVIEAIERGDFADLREELGDLLLQIVFHAQIGAERGLFDFEQVAAAIADKLVERHPHVFAGVNYANDEQRQEAWEESKRQERLRKKPDTAASVLSDIHARQPALQYCEKIQNRAARHGFDWPQTEPVFEKVAEELQETHEAWLHGDQDHVREELGDLLFVVVNLARHLKVDPEMALRQATQKFSRRFNYIEQRIAADGRELLDCELAELDQLWNEAKRTLAAKGPA